MTGVVDEPEGVVGGLCDAVNFLEAICRESGRREDAISLLVQLGYLEIVAEPEVMLTVAEDAPDDVVA